MKTLLVLCLATLVSTQALADKATDIAKKMIDREDGKTAYSKITLLTCRFDPNAEKKKCSAKPRKKVFESVSKDTGKNLKDTRSLSIILEPASDHGVGFVQQDFDDDSKDSEQWIYLPALKKLKRVVSESDSGPKTGTFFGSVLAYEDMEKVHLSDYTYKLLGEESIAGRKAWILESKPTPKRAPKTSYGKNKIWVDKESYIGLKIESYSRTGRLLKTMRNLKLEKVQNIWVARQAVIMDHKDNRMSMMRTDKVVYDLPFSEQMVKVRALNDQNFRESNLKKIRKKAK